jgi:hypothetical protein
MTRCNERARVARLAAVGSLRARLRSALARLRADRATGRPGFGDAVGTTRDPDAAAAIARFRFASCSLQQRRAEAL